MIRHDYAHPVRISPASRQVARADYPRHVSQLLMQLLLTSPGERVCLPEFGCGLRRLVFAPQSAGLETTVKLQVQEAVERWLGDQVELLRVDVRAGADPDSGVDEGAIEVAVSYMLVETRSAESVTVVVV